MDLIVVDSCFGWLCYYSLPKCMSFCLLVACLKDVACPSPLQPSSLSTTLSPNTPSCFTPLHQAVKPDDWNEDEDGEWEPTTIRNPEYKGKWKPKMIANPDYKGKWEHPQIPNPAYKPDDKLSQRCNGCTLIGFELWQVREKSIELDLSTRKGLTTGTQS